MHVADRPAALAHEVVVRVLVRGLVEDAVAAEVGPQRQAGLDEHVERPVHRRRGHARDLRAHALRLAQTWTRDVDNAALSAIAGPGAPDEAGWLPAGLAARIVAETNDADPAVRPFRHPVDWAAFTYLGA